MIIEYLKSLVKESNNKGENQFYIKSFLKEYLQILVLYFFYTNKKYKNNLIFTGGTCLRHFYNLERLSEDLDFDYISNFEIEDLVRDINTYFVTDLKFNKIKISLKQNGKQILLKFPVLKDLNLASSNESDFLYIKCDIEPVKSKCFETIKSSKSKFGYNFVALHYNLTTLFAGKVLAILNRNLLVGKNNRQTIKGRDYYDLLWFLKKDTKINLKYIQEVIQNASLSLEELKQLLDKKVYTATKMFKNEFKSDLIPFIADSKFLNDYLDNFYDEYSRYDLKE